MFANQKKNTELYLSATPASAQLEKKKPEIAFNIFSPDMLLSFPPSILNLLCLFFLINHSHCRNHHGKRRTMYIAKSLPRSELTLKVYKINPIQDAAFCDRYLLNDPEE